MAFVVVAPVRAAADARSRFIMPAMCRSWNGRLHQEQDAEPDDGWFNAASLIERPAGSPPPAWTVQCLARLPDQGDATDLFGPRRQRMTRDSVRPYCFAAAAAQLSAHGTSATPFSLA
jgi:hypothetical protein